MSKTGCLIFCSSSCLPHFSKCHHPPCHMPNICKAVFDPFFSLNPNIQDNDRSSLVWLRVHLGSPYLSSTLLLSVHCLLHDHCDSLPMMVSALTLVPSNFFLQTEDRRILQKHHCIYVSPLYETLQHLFLPLGWNPKPLTWSMGYFALNGTDLLLSSSVPEGQPEILFSMLLFTNSPKPQVRGSLWPPPWL